MGENTDSPSAQERSPPSESGPSRSPTPPIFHPRREFGPPRNVLSGSWVEERPEAAIELERGIRRLVRDEIE
jgi:hypothetical protein